VQQVGRWWNGRWGRLARRDIWLKQKHVWRVEARTGDGDAHVWTHGYPTEAEARTVIRAMIDRNGGPGEWRDLHKLTTTAPKKPKATGDATDDGF
jgi:hypothetical protein